MPRSPSADLADLAQRFAAAIVDVVTDVRSARVVVARGKVRIVLAGSPAVDGERVDLTRDEDGYDYAVMDRVGEANIEQIHAAWCQVRGYV